KTGRENWARVTFRNGIECRQPLNGLRAQARAPCQDKYARETERLSDCFVHKVPPHRTSIPRSWSSSGYWVNLKLPRSCRARRHDRRRTALCPRLSQPSSKRRQLRRRRRVLSAITSRRRWRRRIGKL